MLRPCCWVEERVGGVEGGLRVEVEVMVVEGACMRCRRPWSCLHGIVMMHPPPGSHALVRARACAERRGGQGAAALPGPGADGACRGDGGQAAGAGSVRGLQVGWRVGWVGGRSVGWSERQGQKEGAGGQCVCVHGRAFCVFGWVGGVGGAVPVCRR